MDFEQLSTYSSLGLEGAGVLFLVVVSYKLFKMKIHTRSKCCGLLVETLNRGGSSSNLDFTPDPPQEMKDRRDDRADKNNVAII
jgi:hypothetical protein